MAAKDAEGAKGRSRFCVFCAFCGEVILRLFLPRMPVGRGPRAGNAGRVYLWLSV